MLLYIYAGREFLILFACLEQRRKSGKEPQGRKCPEIYDRKMKKVLKSIIRAIVPGCIVRETLNANGNGAVLLTFDDGPHPTVTPHVLSLLKRYQAKAVFFIPGSRVGESPGLLAEILGEGHKIGNHTFSHIGQSGLKFKDYYNEIERCQQVIYDLSGIKSGYFRPPMGIITPSVIAAAIYSRLKIIRWSVDAGEYNDMRNATSDEIADRLLDSIKSNSIVLLHDDNEKIPHVLEIILPELKRRGFDLQKGINAID